MSMEKIFRNIFWDVNIDTIDPQKQLRYVIVRILEYGNQEQVAWMLNFYNQDQIIKIIKSSGQISARSANFWANYFNLPHKEIRCLNKHFQKTQKALWPY